MPPPAVLASGCYCLLASAAPTPRGSPRVPLLLLLLLLLRWLLLLRLLLLLRRLWLRPQMRLWLRQALGHP
jgi:hypothetical protein